MVKYEKNKYLAMSGIVLGHVPASIVVIFFVPMPSVESIPYIVLSAILHNGYQWFLLSAYKFGNYTRVYPIARGTAPILVAIISLIFLGVVLSNSELLGIFIICLGILSLGFFDVKSFKNKKAIIFALMTGSFIMGYSIVDGYGAKISNSFLSYMGWSFILNAFIFVIVLNLMRQSKAIGQLPHHGKSIFFIGGTMSYLVYGIVVWAFTQAPIALVTTVRESSIIFAILIGILFLKEKLNLLKILSILIMFLGILILRLS